MKKLNTKSLILLLLMEVCKGFSAQTIGKEEVLLLSPAQMQEDIDFLYEELVRMHSNPYQLVSPEKLKDTIEGIKKSISRSINRSEFWLKIGILNQYFDGYTRIYRSKELNNHVLCKV